MGREAARGTQTPLPAPGRGRPTGAPERPKTLFGSGAARTAPYQPPPTEPASARSAPPQFRNHPPLACFSSLVTTMTHRLTHLPRPWRRDRHPSASTHSSPQMPASKRYRIHAPHTHLNAGSGAQPSRVIETPRTTTGQTKARAAKPPSPSSLTILQPPAQACWVRTAVRPGGFLKGKVASASRGSLQPSVLPPRRVARRSSRACCVLVSGRRGLRVW